LSYKYQMWLGPPNLVWYVARFDKLFVLYLLKLS
jgi:hypothetical protein